MINLENVEHSMTKIIKESILWVNYIISVTLIFLEKF